VSDLQTDLACIDAAALMPIVRAVLNDPSAKNTDWRFHAYGHSLDDVYGLAGSIFRFAGTAQRGDRVTPWAAVFKIVRGAATPDDPASPDNGAREREAYRSGILSTLSGVRAPRCYGVTSLPSGAYGLWLEEVVEDLGHQWPAERYVLAARHLARFNGASLAGPNAPAFDWLSRSPLREVVREMAAGVRRLNDAQDHAIVGAVFSPEARATLLELLDRIEPWLDRLDQLPQALCHWDAHRANLISRTGANGEPETVVLDWAALGWGPLGAELSKILSQTVNFFGVTPEALPALDRAMFVAYLDGLRDTGWRGDEAAVRFGHTAASSARLIVRVASALDLAFNDRARAAYERSAGVPFAAIAAKFRATLPYYLALVDEAARLESV